MNTRLSLILCLLLLAPTTNRASGVARIWNEEVLSAIRRDIPNPPVHARNLFHLSVAMYDAWTAMGTNGVGYLYHERHVLPDPEAARREAVSYAAFRLLSERYALSVSSTNTLPALTNRMVSLGYDPGLVTTDPSTPAGVGNRVAAAVSGYFFHDGARQEFRYQDLPVGQGGYVYTNAPLEPVLSGAAPADVNHWQRLKLIAALSQNGIPTTATQSYLGPHWRDVRPFALERDDPTLPWVDPGPPPFWGQGDNTAFLAELVAVIERGSHLHPSDGVIQDFSPGSFGSNNTLGANNGAGHPFNPSTGQAYVANPMPRGDFSRVLAEFWADGPTSETPPGHWNSIANAVMDHPSFQRRIGGVGDVLDELEYEVKLYFALNAAVHDAACAAWTLKRYYDGWRPLSAIRYLAGLGQSSDPLAPSYHPQGLPLVSNLIEVVTTASSAPGQRHNGLSPGRIALRTYGGPPDNPITQAGGVRWIHGRNWLPFQKFTFVTPAFPGYVSGHSTFSRAAAEVLASITGSPFFPGGLGVYRIPAFSMTMERGPSVDVELQWGTYHDAADQAGLSRIWGGIHPPADDFAGRQVGSQVGLSAWALAQRYWDGSVLSTPVVIDALTPASTNAAVRAHSVRGLHYTLESAPAPGGAYLPVASGQTAVDTRTNFTLPSAPTGAFFRVVLDPSL